MSETRLFEEEVLAIVARNEKKSILFIEKGGERSSNISKRALHPCTDEIPEQTLE